MGGAAISRAGRLACVWASWAAAMTWGDLPAQAQRASQTQPAASGGRGELLPEAFAALQEAQQAGSQASRQQALQRAGPIFQKVRLTSPGNPYAMIGLAECMRLTGEGKQALSLYEEYVKTPVGRTDYVGYKGMGLVQLESWPRLALTHLLRAKELKANDPELLQNLALCYLKLRDLNEALRHANLAINVAVNDTDPGNDLEAHRVLAVTHLERGEFRHADTASRRALDLVDKAYKASPSDPEASGRYYELVKFRVDVLKQRLQYTPEDAIAVTVEIVHLMQRLAILEQILSMHQTLDLVQAVLDQVPDAVPLLEQKAELQHQLAMKDEAIKTARRILELDKGNAGATRLIEYYQARPASTQPAGAAGPGGETAVGAVSGG